jgi:peptidyl-tRNA hydrolase, PTH1 family
MESPWLIVGLGNPGDVYVDTYHNVGFRVVQRIARELKVSVHQACGCALISPLVLVASRPAVLVLPQTYMNGSGEALPAVFERFQATISNMIVIYDDIALPLGKLRIRQKGSAGGHNGIKSVVSVLASDEFLRVRVGILPDREVGGVRDFVLSPPKDSDRDVLHRSEQVSAKAVETLIADGIEKAMAVYNGLDLRVESQKDN